MKLLELFPQTDIYYHGSSTALGIDRFILPAQETEKLAEMGRKKNLDKVFFTKDQRSAEIYAHKAVKQFGGDPIVYKVKPVGEVGALNVAPGTSVYMADAAEVVSAEVRPNDVKIH